MKILVTGAAGFIGFHTAKALLDMGYEVFGFDSLNDYYDPKYKYARLKILNEYSGFTFRQGVLEDEQLLTQVWDSFDPSHVINLAAQAGVRYSVENPRAYISANIVGFQNIIELVRHRKVENFIYASSSSVYGGIKELPFSETQDVSQPVSLYAATKIANELVASSYGALYQIPSTGLRFFTVYGPMSRPDMAMFKFAELMRNGSKIPVFNRGNMKRDFTYIDDIVMGIVASLKKPQINQVYNLGKGELDNLLDMIRFLEEGLDIKADVELLPMQLGDVPKTLADVAKAKRDLGYAPKVKLYEGVKRFAGWYRSCYLKS